jgi:ribosomal protein S18 acetylase RimI-like enzyme
MDLAELLALSDLDLVESMREFTRRVPGSVVQESDGVLYFRGWDASSSGIIRTGALPLGDPDGVLDAAEAFFARFGHGYSVLTRAHLDADLERAALARGWPMTNDRPGMVLEHRVEERTLPSGAVLRLVENAEDRRAFAELQAVVFADWADSARALFRDPDGMICTPHSAAYVAEVGGEAASGAMSSVMWTVGAVDWVATLERFRGQGLGEAVTRAASNAAFDLGARIAALQANPEAEKMYARAGYRTITRYRWFERAGA